MKYTVVIVNSRFLQSPQKRSRMEPSYSQALSQNKSIDSGSIIIIIIITTIYMAQ